MQRLNLHVETALWLAIGALLITGLVLIAVATS